MPSLLETKDAKSIKMLVIGESGTGKTGALASLVLAGYKLFVLDFDNGTEILLEIFNKKLADKTITQEEYDSALGRIFVESFFDKVKLTGNTMAVVGMPTAFTKAMKCLSDWPEHGPISDFGDDCIVVIDSLTMMGDAAFRLATAMSQNKDGRAIYGQAQEALQKVLEMLYASSIKCHVIFNSHIKYIETSDGRSKGYPSSIGQALSTKVARYFNVVLGATIQGSGSSAKRVINTKPIGTIDLKCPVLTGLADRLPAAEGLALYFAAKTGRDKI